MKPIFQPAPSLEQLFSIILARKQHWQHAPAAHRSSYPPSYTIELFKKGVPAINSKILEEANEVIEAAQSLAKQAASSSNKAPPPPPNTPKNLPTTAPAPPNTQSQTQQDPITQAAQKAKAHLVHECADVIYHLWVLMAYSHLHLDDIKAELVKRHINN